MPSGRNKAARYSHYERLAACDESFDSGVGKVAGFSLHAGVSARADQRQKLERLCRYISRPAISEKRLSLTPNGNVRYQLKTPYRDGTTHVIFEPLEWMALIPVHHPAGRSQERSQPDPCVGAGSYRRNCDLKMNQQSWNTFGKFSTV